MYKILGFLMGSTLAFAAAPTNGGKGKGPCKQIFAACEAAGFIVKEANIGKGLWLDCIRPIMTGVANPKAKLTVPTIDPAVVTACKQKDPNFGEGKKKK